MVIPAVPDLKAILVVMRILQYTLPVWIRQSTEGTDRSESTLGQGRETHQVQQSVPPRPAGGATEHIEPAVIRQQPELAIAQDLEKARKGDSDAQFNLGCTYLTGWNVERDSEQALRWLRSAGQQGYPDAQFNIGVIYDTGDGVERDPAMAFEWYRKAAMQGLDKAQFNLAVLYFNGDGVVKNHGQAARWFRNAAEQGIAAAQNNLGAIYESGIGVTKDIGTSIQWYRKAAEQGLRESQYMLGVKYGLGYGLPLDQIESFRWLRYAANQGHAASQWLVASFYFEGLGVLQDNIEAYRWALLAKYRDHSIDPTCVDMFRAIQKSLGSKQVKYDDSYASQWKAKDWEKIEPTRNDPEKIETPDGPRFRLDAPIKAVKRLLERWHISADHTAKFMGFDSSMQIYAEELLTGHRILIQGSEAEDRIAILYYIRCILGALFQDSGVENEWLRRPHPELGGKSPMDLMQSGSRTDLLAARHHVDWVSGRLGC